ncbi:MAG TPA: thioesterase family protein [Vicinamibacterales bacterium]|nr:thioesterase family protein [Vicinamibacterales bacterium]
MEFTFSHQIDVRFRDCDPMGHANNAVYLTYLEQARFAHWRALWGFRGGPPRPGEPGVIMAHAEIDYRKPVEYGDRLEVRLAIAAIGRTSFTYDYELVDQSKSVVASARTVQVMYDYASARPVPIPERVRELLARHVRPVV